MPVNGKVYMMILYFIDETDNLKLQKEYNDSKSCVGIIMIDNYEETMQAIEDTKKGKNLSKTFNNVDEMFEELEK